MLIDVYLGRHTRRPRGAPFWRGHLEIFTSIMGAEKRVADKITARLMDAGACGWPGVSMLAGATFFPAADQAADPALDPYVKALRRCVAAMQTLPPVGQPYGAQHRTAIAYAITVAQTAVRMAEDGRRCEPDQDVLAMLMRNPDV